jgi:drug/metabolite transporter superfamily protein YnfA
MMAEPSYAKLTTFVRISNAGESYDAYGDVAVLPSLNPIFCLLQITLEDGTSLAAQLDHDGAIAVLLGLAGFVGKQAAQ